MRKAFETVLVSEGKGRSNFSIRYLQWLIISHTALATLTCNSTKDQHCSGTLKSAFNPAWAVVHVICHLLTMWARIHTNM